MTSARPAEGTPTRPNDVIRSAFRDLHGPALHGFALLVTLGDRRQAARLAASALDRGAERAEQLSHPERAAAWLRRQVVREARNPGRGAGSPAEQREALGALGVDQTLMEALRPLSPRDRAALVASGVEWLSRTDAAESADTTLSGVRHARRRFLEAHLAAANRLGSTSVDGPLARRVREAAATVIGRRP
jgi:DNA-directed RNA polymerase specialized sigma24 family protein